MRVPDLIVKDFQGLQAEFADNYLIPQKDGAIGYADETGQRYIPIKTSAWARACDVEAAEGLVCSDFIFSVTEYGSMLEMIHGDITSMPDRTIHWGERPSISKIEVDGWVQISVQAQMTIVLDENKNQATIQ